MFSPIKKVDKMKQIVEDKKKDAFLKYETDGNLEPILDMITVKVNSDLTRNTNAIEAANNLITKLKESSNKLNAKYIKEKEVLEGKIKEEQEKNTGSVAKTKELRAAGKQKIEGLFVKLEENKSLVALHENEIKKHQVLILEP